ncbi:NosD domain-containing protein [Caulobacter mirabilis]|uniref:Periplasmic copper-binding protein NosD beta helix domain-containing protein n=1 Tax=Caulobacter mirabilis TaxID=69666 RepID=A0A2D2AXJ8_9CAUL|nr:NosD domain-containing protein [Caulobacter mirabilis]ATQ42703.1 hypothetical protein CSW64_09910 [Caulobacter mirabilis]
MTNSPENFGAVGDGVANDAAAWQAAVDTGRPIQCGPGRTYRLDGAVFPSKAIDIDLNGSTIALHGAHNFLNRDGAFTATTTVASGATEGSLQVVVANPAGIVEGGWLAITAVNSPPEDVLFYPFCWSRVSNVTGAAVSLDRPLPVTFLGTVSAYFVSAAQMLPKCRIANGVIDGARCTKNDAEGLAFRLQFYEDFVMDGVTIRNFRASTPLNVPLPTRNVVQTINCVRQTVTDCTWTDIESTAACASFQQSNSIHFSNNTIDCSAFGVNITKAVTSAVTGNTIVGRWRAEAAQGVPRRSIRGVKVSGVTWPQIVGNHCSDFESPIRIEAQWGGTIIGNTVSYGGGNHYAVALNVSAGNVTQSRGVIIANNQVRDSNGTGIGYQGATPGAVTIMGNIVQNVQFVGIYAPTANSIISGNRVENWNLGRHDVEGVYPGAGATITGNRFARPTDAAPNARPDPACIRAASSTGAGYVIRDNLCETANPMLIGGGTQ